MAYDKYEYTAHLLTSLKCREILSIMINHVYFRKPFNLILRYLRLNKLNYVDRHGQKYFKPISVNLILLVKVRCFFVTSTALESQSYPEMNCYVNFLV